MRKTILVLLALLLATGAYAQIGTPPGISNPGGGGPFFTPMLAPTGCTTKPYSFTGLSTTVGMCYNSNTLALFGGTTASLSLAATTGNITASGSGTAGNLSFTGTGSNVGASNKLYAAAGGSNSANLQLWSTTNDGLGTISYAYQNLYGGPSASNVYAFRASYQNAIAGTGGWGIHDLYSAGWETNLDWTKNLYPYPDWPGQYQVRLRRGWGGGDEDRTQATISLQGEFDDLTTESGQAQAGISVSNQGSAYWGLRVAGLDVYTDHASGQQYADLGVTGQSVKVKEHAGDVTDHPIGASITSQYNGAWEQTAVGSGFTLDGSTTAPTYPTAAKVNVLVTDTTDTVNAGAIYVCGKLSVYNPVTCEALTLVGLPSPGPTTLTTVNDYLLVTSIKSVAAGALDGAGDELVSAEWPDTTSIASSANLVNHATKGTLTPANTIANYYEVICPDPNGCNFVVGGQVQNGWEITLVGGTGTQPTLLTNAANLVLANGSNFTLDAGESIKLVWSASAAAYIEEARSGLADTGIIFQGATSDTFTTRLAVTDPTASNTLTIPDVSGTLLISTTANVFDTSNAFWVNTGNLIFEGSTANAYETAVNVLDPTEDRTISFPDSNGIVEVRSQAATSGAPGNLYAMMIEGGYALDGTLTTTPASTVTITLADPEADSTPAQNVEICGYEDATNKVLYVLSCVIVAATEGAGNVTVPTFVEVTHVKGAGKAGDDADDTIAVAFTTGPVSIRSATAIADSAKSDITPSAAINGSSIALYCADPAGCDFQPGDPGSAADGKTLILMVKSGSAAIVVKDDDTLVDLAGDADLTLDDFDTLTLIWLDASSRWLQTAASNN